MCALALMVIVTAAPTWPPALALVAGVIRLLLPVEQFALLALVAIACCAVVGWWAGGRLLLALPWVLLAGYALWRIPLPVSGYGAFVRGWTLVVSGAFGLVCVATRARPFLGRALAAVALAAVVTLGGTATRGSAGLEPAVGMFTVEYGRRLDEALRLWRERTTSTLWQGVAAKVPDAGERADRLAGSLAALAEPAPAGESAFDRPSLLSLVPALLGLESLLALALGWATYHRLSRVRIGPPLSPLRGLRFNDQLVWGLVVGAVLLLLPTLADWRGTGFNLLVFFGTLYALRGAGVLTWYVPERYAVAALLALLVLVPLLGPAVTLALVVALTFGLGLGDTWRDFRAGATPRRPSSLP